MKNKKSIIMAIALAALSVLPACGNADKNEVPTTSGSEITAKVTVGGGTSEKEETQTAGTDEELTQIHLPDETVEIDVSDLETGVFGEDLGEYKDDSYWEGMIGTGNDEEPMPAEGNSVFIVSVDADTTDEMMQEVIDKYDLDIVYDYDSFSMYALSVPEPLDDEQTEQFIRELTDSYSFILMVEPDSVMYLDDASVQ